MLSSIILALSALLMHPVHETVSEVEWNPDTSRLEIALRLSVLDEQWLGRQASKNKKLEQWAIEYLQRRYVTDESSSNKEKPSAKYHWVGREQMGAHVWWYFEIAPANKQRPREVTQRMLFERNEGYTNRVVVMDKKKRRAVTLTASKPTAKLP